MRSFAYKNNSSVYIDFLIMSPDAYFTSISFPEHSSAINKNISVVLGRVIKQVNTECDIQK